MSAPTSSYGTPSLTVAHPDGAALRVVLFGMPDAGKSSLLGALAQSAQSQDRGLHGRLLDLTHGLAELWRRVYENRPRETLDEIVPYPVYFERFISDPNGQQRIPLMLYDCDGRVANEILSQRRALQRDPKAGPLAQAVLDADALILVVDGSAMDAQIDQDFREFVRLLKTIQKYRSHDHAVGGLPVHLVLTKCDLLAHEPITAHAWESRIEQRKQQVVDRFSDFLRTEGVEGFNFGSIDLHINATAVKRPGLAEVPAQPREPFGVAELFYECFENAEGFRDRVARADRRLKYTVFGAAGLLGRWQWEQRSCSASAAPKIGRSIYRARLRSIKRPKAICKVVSLPRTSNIARKNSSLCATTQASINWVLISNSLSVNVSMRFRPIRTFATPWQKLTRLPTVRSLEALAETKKKLETDAGIPKEYQSEWDKPQNAPDAVVDRRQKLEQIQRLTTAVGELRRFYTTLDNEGKDLIYDAKLDNTWERDVLDSLERQETSFSEVRIHTRGAAFEFRNVASAQQDWQARQYSLQRLQEFALALGILRGTGKADAPLMLRESNADADINSLAATRLQSSHALPQLQVVVVDRPQGYGSPALFLERLKVAYRNTILDGKKLILRRLKEINPTGPESPSDWSKIADWLKSPAVQEWSELTSLLAKYLNPDGEDPVVQTITFRRKKQFAIEIRSLKSVSPTI